MGSRPTVGPDTLDGRKRTGTLTIPLPHFYYKWEKSSILYMTYVVLGMTWYSWCKNGIAFSCTCILLLQESISDWVMYTHVNWSHGHKVHEWHITWTQVWEQSELVSRKRHWIYCFKIRAPESTIAIKLLKWAITTIERFHVVESSKECMFQICMAKSSIF